MKYYYIVNTFARDGEPVTLRGETFGGNEVDAIQNLIDDGTIDPRGYEFLDLREVNNIVHKNL